MDTVNEQQGKTFPATLVSISNPRRVVINRGSLHGIKIGQRFLIYSLSKEEIKDPTSGESLGYLEIVKGVGKVIHIQEKMSTIESERKEEAQRTIVKTSSSSPTSLFSMYESLLRRQEAVEETILPSSNVVPFENPQIGDKAKPI